MARLDQDKFRIFVSHKHEDGKLAHVVKETLEKLSPDVECFYSGEDIAGGRDWRLEVKNRLASSHLLVLLYTLPSHDWDWCLYETGLYLRFEADEVFSVACLFDPGSSMPRPLTNIQGIKAEHEPETDTHPERKPVKRFLDRLYRETWSVSDSWLKGQLNGNLSEDDLDKSAATIVSTFSEVIQRRTADDAESIEVLRAHHPCHRVVLDLSEIQEFAGRIPDQARIVEDEGATAGYTLSLFGASSGPRQRTWGELVDAIEGWRKPWLEQLDHAFAASLDENLFPPITATVRAWDTDSERDRLFKPMLYSITRAENGTARPVRATIVFNRQLSPDHVGGKDFDLLRVNARFATEVFDRYAGKLAGSSTAVKPRVFDAIRQAFLLIEEEADTDGVLTEDNVRRILGDRYDESGIAEKCVAWQDARKRLDTAIGRRDVDLTESILDEMRSLNTEFSTMAARRYIETLNPSAVEALV